MGRSAERAGRNSLRLPRPRPPGELEFAGTLRIDGSEEFDIRGLENGIKPQMEVSMTIHRSDGSTQDVPLLLRIDTPIEVDYYRHGGILPFVLRELLAA